MGAFKSGLLSSAVPRPLAGSERVLSDATIAALMIMISRRG